MRRFLAVLALILLVMACAPGEARSRQHAGHGPEGWTVYSDPDTGTTVDYPANIFSVEGDAPKQGKGVQLYTADKLGSLLIYALPNANGDTPSAYVEQHLALQRRALNYARITRRFFALSGSQGDTAFYSRCNFIPAPDNMMHCIYLEYPERDARAWDNIVARISLSLRAENGRTSHRNSGP